MFYKKSSKSNKIRCEICSNYCKINDGKLGICKQYKNENGELKDCNFAVVSALNVDPIEKKPLYHFLPNTYTYSVGGFGCNMDCLFCQNYIISQCYDSIDNKTKILPETIVENAINSNCQSISWTYNEPTIHLPFNMKTSRIAQKKNLKIIYVSNGYMSQESLTEILKFTDAFNIDLKAMSEDFYRNLCKADLNVVLENLKTIKNSGKHLEVTNLLINDYNDSEKQIKKLVNFVKEELGSDTPLHFSRAFPYYKMDNIEPTEKETLYKAKRIAEEAGIKHVHLGNLF